MRCRLSVLMPVFNEEDTVNKIINAVLAVPVDLELIVVDDGSTDRTPSRLHALEPPATRASKSSTRRRTPAKARPSAPPCSMPQAT